MKILFTGGGSGGHVLPIIALAREIRKIFPGEKLEFLYMGPKDQFGNILLSQENIKIKNVMSGKLRRYVNYKSVIQNIIDILFRIPLGIFQAFWFMFFYNPDLVFSKGGFGSIPVVISAWFFRIPIFLHESDIAPGLANKTLSMFALEIFVSFPRTEYFSPKKMILVGNPIRKNLLNGSKLSAKQIFNLTGEKPVLLVLGGSQGAQRINNRILDLLPRFLEKFEIIHHCGEKNFKIVKAESEVVIDEKLKKYYHLLHFLKEEQLKHAYQVSDFIISRAGSGSIFEIAAVGKPSILVPLPGSAQDHQLKNAYAFAKNGAAVVLEEENFTSRFLLEKLNYLISKPEKLEEMSSKARLFSKPEAARIIAEYLIAYLSS